MIRAKRVDTRREVWSMGVVLHHLVTGMMPFAAEALTELVARVLQEEPVLPSEQRPGLPEELDTVVTLCLQRRPEHRFQAIEELAAALRVLTSSGGPDPAVPASVDQLTDPGGQICGGDEGQVPCYDHFHTSITLTSDGKHFKVPVGCLFQTGFGLFEALAQDRLQRIQFSLGPGHAFGFWIDDVAFYE
ncbi:hypothetical protein BE18_46155 [Sorangium cellulosum]|uniref:Protein kinase domain-containing protein n=1 Tax=Sorangium cellulosum TaxID=56 RepID=A0A150T571_SORCE|nr:hypothetical protein BE18_46155 [Sorangium cellulosum]